MKGLVDQIAVCCGAQFSNEAKILWIYVATGGRGRGKDAICEHLGWTEEAFIAARDELAESKLIRVKTGKHTAGPFALDGGESSSRVVRIEELDADKPRTPSSLDERVEFALAAYNVYRVAGGAPPVEPDGKSRKKFTELIAWLIDEGATFVSYLETLIRVSERFLATRELKVLPLNILTGEWAREQWTVAKGTGPTLADKADGKKQLNLIEVRKYLEKNLGVASISVLRDEDLRFVVEWANNMIESPTFYPNFPDDFIQETRVAKRGLECGVIRA